MMGVAWIFIEANGSRMACYVYAVAAGIHLEYFNVK